MKQTLITIAILTLSFSISKAQKLDIRAFAGVNQISLAGDLPSNIEQRGKLGFQAGLSVSYGKMFYINPGIYWSNQRIEVTTIQDDGSKIIDKPSVHMTSIPLKVGFRLIPPDLVNIVNARVFGGLRTNFFTDISGSDYKKDDFKTTNMAIDLGMGIDILSFFAEIEYGIGISPIFVNSANNTKINTFSFNLGYRLTIN